ncbi:hypothetical protein PFTANZ_04735 [Plasmodium falciparum Tanzania (2000708)]|uniref:Uncharacterized protein n=1 Tax=Plasmodium falciparum Tanzania (2000708) TaxID=1036725 RepID=A0A024W1H0_PLAFA|nr:hypothetical protein PFTANZ_04735 [Plasmodium falciparum Tanzania (2000708)]
MAIFKKSIIIFLFFTFFNYCFSQDVIELNDSNFESLTQLSTGNTTENKILFILSFWLDILNTFYTANVLNYVADNDNIVYFNYKNG